MDGSSPDVCYVSDSGNDQVQLIIRAVVSIPTQQVESELVVFLEVYEWDGALPVLVPD